MEQNQELVLRVSGELTPFNAADVVAAVCDLYDMPIPRQHRARLGKAAKELLEDGFAADVVCHAVYSAVCMSRPHLVTSLAAELQTAKAGKTLTWERWRDIIYSQRVEADPELTRIYQLLREGTK